LAFVLGSRDGNTRIRIAKAINPIPEAAKNTFLQPIKLPRKLPSGAAKTDASELPPKMIDNAFPTDFGGTIRAAIAAAIAQTPPSAIPRRTRPISATVKFGASPTIKLETNKRNERLTRTVLRFKYRVKYGVNKLAMTANTEVTVTVKPAVPSLTWKSNAIGVNRLGGRNSATIRPATAKAIAHTAPQDGFIGTVEFIDFAI
jgi:hypothetical protein